MLTSIHVELEHAKGNLMQVAVEVMDDRGMYEDKELQYVTKKAKELYDELDSLDEHITALIAKYKEKKRP